jgi:RNA polymerase sigma factor (TIGR02999 family)
VAPRTVTVLLREWRAGDHAAIDELMPLVYDELRRIAARALCGERADHTWRPTDLVSEAYLRLCGAAQPDWNDRVHFFAVAARNMRQILVDHARARRADKRGGGVRPVELDEGQVAAKQLDDLVALDEALRALAARDERKARVIELSYFAGLSHAEIAQVLAVTEKTVARDLRFCEAWLSRHLTAPA